MMRRRRSSWRYIVLPLVVGLVLWWCRVWPFSGTKTPPAASIPAVGEVVQKAYEALPAGVRDRVPVDQFTGMFHRMADPDRGGELPAIQQASVAEGTGPEHPVARFQVEYPGGKAKAEYHFARIDGIWQLQSFTRVPRELKAAALEVKKPREGVPVGPPPEPEKPAKEAPAKQDPTPPEPNPDGPQHYVVQPGDTLSTISQRFYGTTRYWHRLIEANPGISERKLRVGRRLLIPSRPEPAPPKEDDAAEPQP